MEANISRGEPVDNLNLKSKASSEGKCYGEDESIAPAFSLLLDHVKEDGAFLGAWYLQRGHLRAINVYYTS